MWAHIAKFPERQKNSNRAMKAQSFDGVWSVGLFPFAEKIKELGKETDASTPLVVDIGGGAGHTSAKIREDPSKQYSTTSMDGLGLRISFLDRS